MLVGVNDLHRSSCDSLYWVEKTYKHQMDLKDGLSTRWNGFIMSCFLTTLTTFVYLFIFSSRLSVYFKLSTKLRLPNYDIVSICFYTRPLPVVISARIATLAHFRFCLFVSLKLFVAFFNLIYYRFHEYSFTANHGSVYADQQRHITVAQK